MTGGQQPTTAARGSDVMNVLGSEFLKLTTTRSTVWTLAAAVAFNVGFAVLAALALPAQLSAQDRETVDGIRLSLAGLHLSQIAVGALGALVVTSEYSSGMIRATFGAVPRRRLVLAAKAIVFAATALVVGLVSCVAAYATFQALLPDSDSLRSALDDPGVPRAVFGGGLYLAVLGLLGLGLGAIIRATAGTIAALFGLLFVPSILMNVLPQAWQESAGRYLPLEAGSQIFIAAQHDPNTLGPWTGFALFTLYAGMSLAVGFFLITRRDA